MTTVTDAGGAGTPVDFVRTSSSSPYPRATRKITGLADLTDQAKVALCAAQVPCGAAAEKALDAARYAQPGHPGAGRQGGAGQGELRLRWTPPWSTAPTPTRRPTMWTGSSSPSRPGGQRLSDRRADGVQRARTSAQAFVAYVRSPEGKAVLADAGFAKPG